MAQQRNSRLPLYPLTLPPVAVIIVLISCFVLTVGVIFLTAYSPLLGVIGTFGIAVLVFLFLQSRWIMPLYILLAVPGVYVSLIPSQSLSGLYLGDLMLALLIVIGLVRAIWYQDKSRQPLRLASPMLPLLVLALVGLASIIYSALQPDLHVVNGFLGADVPLIKKGVVLIILPVMLLISSGLMRRIGDVKWVVRAYMGIGILFALGTIFAKPLGLQSQEMILGVARPQVFGWRATELGLLLVLFTNIALGHALYASTRITRFYWWALTLLCGIATILVFDRAAWITLFFSVLVMLVMRFKRVSVLLLVPLFLLPLLIPGVSDFFNPDKVYGFDRFTIWQDAISLWLNHPYFGVGAGDFGPFDIVYGIEPVGFAHNQFLEVLAEMGVQGLLSLILSLLAIGWLTLKRFKAATTSQGKAIALAYIGYFITIIIGGFFADTFLPSASAGGGTAALVLESYHWLLLGLVFTMPRWENSVQVATESVQLVTKPSQPTELRTYAEKPLIADSI